MIMMQREMPLEKLKGTFLLEEAICYGHAAAAICVTRKGGQPSIPKQEEVEAFVTENNIGFF